MLVTGYELDFFGRLRSLTDAAQASAVAADEGAQDHADQPGRGGGRHLPRAAGRRRAARADAAARWTRALESLRLIQLRFDDGAASELDLQAALSLVANARATLAQGQRQRALDENALVLLLGQPLPADLPPAPTLAQLALGPQLPAGLPSALLERRPDIRAAEAQLVAAEANLGAARAAFFPLITLTASAGTSSTELSGLFKSGSWGWGIAPQLLFTLFDAGPQPGQPARGRGRARESPWRSTTRRSRARSAKWPTRWPVAPRSASNCAPSSSRSTPRPARLRLADLRYRNGVASSLDLLDAQRSLFATQQQTLLVQLAQVQNQVSLYKALGGGWSEPTATGARP